MTAYYWKPARKFAARFVLLTAPNYPAAALRLKQYGIETNGSALQALAQNEKMYRPLISANYGGKRR